MKYLSVCSGIEAASVAWHPLGWAPVAFSEIEAFPSAVLAHHYPDVPNLGDMTEMDVEPLGDIDILVGGTPCQAFSVAGLRQSLDDARGNLTLSYVRLIHELVEHHALRNAVWENVPGVLSTKDNAFGCFLGAIVGSDDPLVSPGGGRWPNAGMVSGPKGRAAWRVLDAQYFGLAQRRRRVFVVSDFGSGADPAAVLFEREGVLGNPAPRRETRKDVAHPIAPSLTSSGRGVERGGDTQGQDPVVAVQVSSTGEISHCLNAGGMGRIDYETETMIATSVTGDISHTLKAEGFDASEDGTGRGNPIIAFDTTQITSKLNRSNPKAGDPVHPLAAGAHPPAIAYRTAGDGAVYQEGDRTAPLTTATDPNANIIAFSSKDYGADAGEISPTLRAGGHDGSHANAGVPPAIVINGNSTPEIGHERAFPLRADDGSGNRQALQHGSAVRRLTPVECERLQGFPDDYTRIPMPKKGKKVDPVWAADGPRYKALGNSMAAPVMRWIGERIDRFMPREEVAPPVKKQIRFAANGRMVFE